MSEPLDLDRLREALRAYLTSSSDHGAHLLAAVTGKHNDEFPGGDDALAELALRLADELAEVLNDLDYSYLNANDRASALVTANATIDQLRRELAELRHLGQAERGLQADLDSLRAENEQLRGQHCPACHDRVTCAGKQP